MKLKIFSIIGLLCYMLLGGASLSCPGAAIPVAVTMVRIASKAGTLMRFLNWAKEASNEAHKSVNVSYLKLSDNLSKKQVNGKSIGEMEVSLNRMKGRIDTLRLVLDRTEEEAKGLFEMITIRADENKTKELKKMMLADIETKQGIFNDKIKIARDVQKQLEASIQKYDDILGFIQVSSTLNDIDQYINQINTVINEGSQLNNNIISAIDEGLAIVSAIEKQADESAKVEKKAQ
jgi:hypothetical protein